MYVKQKHEPESYTHQKLRPLRNISIPEYLSQYRPINKKKPFYTFFNLYNFFTTECKMHFLCLNRKKIKVFSLSLQKESSSNERTPPTSEEENSECTCKTELQSQLFRHVG